MKRYVRTSSSYNNSLKIGKYLVISWNTNGSSDQSGDHKYFNNFDELDAYIEKLDRNKSYAMFELKPLYK